MRSLLCTAGLLAVVVASYGLLGNSATEAGKQETMLAHDVYFTLKDNSDEAKQKLVSACKKHLSGHPGEVFFATGTRAKEFDRKVNDTAYDVSLLILFKDKAAHDVYQDAKRHLQFIDENKDNWKTVRVFDSTVTK